MGSEPVQVTDCRDLDEKVGLFKKIVYPELCWLDMYADIRKKAQECERAVDNQGNQCYLWIAQGGDATDLRCRKTGEDTGLGSIAITALLQVPAWCWDPTVLATWEVHPICWKTGLPA
ncbi:unnamed protein product [Amoebophrya sp. A120]|nr:unnamed protein product [Amoebophrya sp. A120]|eukprot:GSA120T00000510001.1